MKIFIPIIAIIFAVARTDCAFEHKVLDCNADDVCFGVKEGAMDSLYNYTFKNGTMTPKNESDIGCIFNHDCTSMIRFVKNPDAKPSFGTMYIIIDDINLSPAIYPRLFTHLIISKKKVYTAPFVTRSRIYPDRIYLDKIFYSTPVIYAGRDIADYVDGVFANIGEVGNYERLEFWESDLVNYFNCVEPINNNYIDKTGRRDIFFREYNFGEKVTINEINHVINLLTDKTYIYLYRHYGNLSSVSDIILDTIEVKTPFLLFQTPNETELETPTTESGLKTASKSRLWLWISISGLIAFFVNWIYYLFLLP